MKRLIRSSVTENRQDDIFCMANVRGNSVHVPHSLPFSFYFSSRNSSHGIRVKPVFNANKMAISMAGNLELHGKWEYTPGKYDTHINKRDIDEMKQFFRKYKVLFAGVWEEVIQEQEVQDYFRGLISWNELVESFEFYEDYAGDLDAIDDVESLETYVRQNIIFNMND